MHRTAEPELMTEADQVEAYALADFDQPHERFIELLRERFPDLPREGTALDLGCGPGDVARRFARAFPGWLVHGLDGSLPMIEWGRSLVARADLAERVSLHVCHLPAGMAPLLQYDLVYSNSVLHHLADPLALWRSVQRWGQRPVPVFVMDLLRPDGEAEVELLVERYSNDDPEVLRRDFRNSLHAAYRAEEVRMHVCDLASGTAGAQRTWRACSSGQEKAPRSLASNRWSCPWTGPGRTCRSCSASETSTASSRFR